MISLWMEDLLMFSVKSHRGSYNVYLTDDIPVEEFSDSFMVIDSVVLKLYPHLNTLVDSKRIFILDATEDHKTIEYCSSLIEFLIKAGFKKNNNLVAVGGGITQDITSFTASILFRGVEWRFIPTTLLAQADSCIGSKTSINFFNTKNVLGTFYPPSKIWCNENFLETLCEEDIDSGIGEMLHYFMITNSKHLRLIDKNNLKPSIEESLSIKKAIIEIDEFDKKERRVFNYGHTFGHAVEVISNYSIRHGVAVTIGMHMANYVSYKLGLISEAVYKYLQSCIEFNLPEFRLANLDEYMNILQKDKKNINKSIVCILPHGIANMQVTPITDLAALKQILISYTDECN